MLQVVAGKKSGRTGLDEVERWWDGQVGQKGRE